ncbi:MAG: hypothetical protein ACLR32_08150 [Acutalibacteraceae bacterium]
MLAKNIFNENLLMAVASLGAFAIGEYSEGCAVVLLYTVGEFLQSLAVQRAADPLKVCWSKSRTPCGYKRKTA